jgi:hypothetical protein
LRLVNSLFSVFRKARGRLSLPASAMFPSFPVFYKLFMYFLYKNYASNYPM